MKPLKRSVRRGRLVAHGAVSVSWLGLTTGLLALGLTAFTTGGPATVGAVAGSVVGPSLGSSLGSSTSTS
ncbi:hypothetical protein [Streptomyces sindenensis]|uniref:Uncharacterized protein n=1 Tax=Streptomyces sindenensis TaxID=67363 RepID=A0ABW6EG77_9ACTN